MTPKQQAQQGYYTLDHLLMRCYFGPSALALALSALWPSGSNDPYTVCFKGVLTWPELFLCGGGLMELEGLFTKDKVDGDIWYAPLSKFIIAWQTDSSCYNKTYHLWQQTAPCCECQRKQQTWQANMWLVLDEVSEWLTMSLMQQSDEPCPPGVYSCVKILINIKTHICKCSSKQSNSNMASSPSIKN